MKYIYFHVDELYRDLITAVNLSKKFPPDEYKFIYGNRRNYSLLLKFSDYFDAVIFPKPLFLSYAKHKKWSCNVYYLYTENIGIIAKKKYPKMILKGVLDQQFMEGDQHYVESAKGFFLWGHNAYNTVKKYHPKIIDKMHVVGHPRHDISTLKNYKNRNKKGKAINVGFLTRNCYLNDYIQFSPLENLGKYLKFKIPYEYFNNKKDFLINERRGSQPAFDIAIESIDTKNLFIIIAELNKEFDDINIFFKVHPREKYENWFKILQDKNLNIQICDKSEPFTHWLNNLDYVIGPPSTSFYDACMLGVQPISIHKLDKKREIFVKKMYEENNELTQYLFSPKSVRELINFIKSSKNKSILNEKKINKILKDEANYPSCKDSLTKVSKIIKSDLKNKKISKNILLILFMRSIYKFFYLILNSFFRKEVINSSNFRFGLTVKKIQRNFS